MLLPYVTFYFGLLSAIAFSKTKLMLGDQYLKKATKKYPHDILADLNTIWATRQHLDNPPLKLSKVHVHALPHKNK